MPHHLMNLRNVPDDEADEIRALFERNEVPFYETPPSRWGISMGGFWVHDGNEATRARALLADYQRQRREQARSAYEQAFSEGRVPGLWQHFCQRPVTVLAAALAIAFILGLTVAPYLGI